MTNSTPVMHLHMSHNTVDFILAKEVQIGVKGIAAKDVKAGGKAALIVAGGVASGIVMVCGAIAFGIFALVLGKGNKEKD